MSSKSCSKALHFATFINVATDRALSVESIEKRKALNLFHKLGAENSLVLKTARY